MEEKKVFYTNSIGVETSGFDVKMKINYTTTENNEILNSELCEIVMSPQHAKAFAQILNSVVQDYEKNFGEINLNSEKKKEE